MTPKPKIVIADDERPAGRKGECFYCKKPVGALHKTFCVIASAFPATIRITDTKTGETREYKMDEYEDEDGWSSYSWVEGNYSCNDNRGNFFARAGGEDDYDLPCGDGRFRVDAVIRDSNGEILYAEKP